MRTPPPQLPPFSFQGLDAASQVAINVHVRQRQFVAAIAAMSGTGSMTADATVRSALLKPQHRQRSALIEIADLSCILPYLQEFRWWLIACLVYKLLVSAITNQYHLEGEWHLKWFDGKITFTPTKKVE